MISTYLEQRRNDGSEVWRGTEGDDENYLDIINDAKQDANREDARFVHHLDRVPTETDEPTVAQVLRSLMRAIRYTGKLDNEKLCINGQAGEFLAKTLTQHWTSE